jgi:hypothetical protein
MVLVCIAAGALLVAHGLVHLLYRPRRCLRVLDGLSVAWPGLVAAAGLLSMVLLILFWNTWLVLGCAIDIGFLTVALIRPDWVEQLIP